MRDDFEHEPRGGTPLAQVRLVGYATRPNAHIYRAIVHVLYENRTLGIRLRMSPIEIAAEARARYGVELDQDDLARHLDELYDLRVVDRVQNFERVRTAAELRRNHYSYDITRAGQEAEEFFDRLASLEEVVGALEAVRLPSIRQHLHALEQGLAAEPRDEATLSAALTGLVAELRELHQGASQFMRELSAFMASVDSIDEQRFHDYKAKVTEYLGGFYEQLGQHDADIKNGIRRLAEPERQQEMLEAIARVDIAPHPELSEEEVLRRRIAAVGRDWEFVRSWFLERQSPLEALNGQLRAAIDWILRGARRLRERHMQRINRASEYRALACLFDGAPNEDACHAIFDAAFGLFGARHYSVPEEDPELAGPTDSFWDASPAPVQGYLRRPGRSPAALGRVAALPDDREARLLALQEAEEQRRLVARLLEQTPGGPVRISALAALPQASFELLLDALGQALAEGDGGWPRQALSDDGSLRLTVFDGGDERPRALLELDGQGRLECPDFLLELAQVGRLEARA